MIKPRLFIQTMTLTGSGSDEDNLIYLKHYACEQYRNDWTHDSPDDPLPAVGENFRLCPKTVGKFQVMPEKIFI